MIRKRLQVKDGVQYIEYEGLTFIVASEKIKQGDLYLAERNTGIKLLTCEEVNPSGWIVPKEKDYCYDVPECIKVIEIK